MEHLKSDLQLRSSQTFNLNKTTWHRWHWHPHNNYIRFDSQGCNFCSNAMTHTIGIFLEWLKALFFGWQVDKIISFGTQTQFPPTTCLWWASWLRSAWYLLVLYLRPTPPPAMLESQPKGLWSAHLQQPSLAANLGLSVQSRQNTYCQQPGHGRMGANAQPSPTVYYTVRPGVWPSSQGQTSLSEPCHVKPRWWIDLLVKEVINDLAPQCGSCVVSRYSATIR